MADDDRHIIRVNGKPSCATAGSKERQAVQQPRTSETILPEDLLAFTTRVFRALGVEEQQARTWAEVLVWADLRGVSSHGVLRVPSYVEHIRKGDINPRAKMSVTADDGALQVLDAGFGPGPVAMTAAMQLAVDRARRLRVGWCAVRDLTHCGAIGYFAQAAASQGMIALTMSASQPMMAYPGSRSAAVSTNPLAIAVPRKDAAPLVLDFATSNVAMGKILQARQQGSSVPHDWGLDDAGQPTTDPSAITTLSPMAGAKGAGLSLMIECLTSLFVRRPLVAPALQGAFDPARPMNALAIAVDPAGFGDPQEFCLQVDVLASAITALPRAEGVDCIHAPGERGNTLLVRRRSTGVPLSDQTLRALTRVANELGLPPLSS